VDVVRTTGRARVARGAAAVLTAAVLLVPAGGAALADPDVTDQDVRDARRAVTSASGAVASIEVRLAELSTRADAAEIAVQQAGEGYAQAQADLATAQQEATRAADQYGQAAEQFEAARATLVAIAREAARSGGSMDTLQAVLSAEGFEDVVSRSEGLSHVSAKADQAVQGYLAAEQVATTLKSKAEQAEAAQEAAAAESQTALTAAEQAQTDADTAVASAQTERQGLIVQLAAARSTSTEVEQARQDQVDAERRARAEAAAQAERTTPAATTPTSPGAGTTTPSTPTPSTPSTPATPPSTPPATTPPATTPPVTTPPVTTPPVTTPPASGGSSSGSTASADAAIAWAKTKLGLPYLWGGVGPNGYDCSGLTQGAWRSAGVSLNRTSRDQYRQVKKISYNEMRPGDLVFWGSNPNDASSVYHVAMYLGGGQIIEAPSPGKTVRITSMRYSGTMAFAGRP
jgi:cell wall-associated NlpC family hydrolase